MADGHDAWYRRELDRGRRFHGAFAGGFSAGYHNTVGSAEGWQPASFRSSRTKRQRVAGARPEEIGDAEDGLLGRTVAVGAGYGSRAGDAAGPATAGARAVGGAASPRRAARPPAAAAPEATTRYATGAGEEDEEDRAPLSRAAAVPMLDGARFCVGRDGRARAVVRRARRPRRVPRRRRPRRCRGGVARLGRRPFATRAARRRVVVTRGLGAFVDAAPPRRLCAARRRGRRARGRRRAIRADGVRREGRRRGRRPGRLLAGTPAPGAGGRLRDAATRRPGTLAGFSRAAAVPPPPPPAALARPPRAWRGVHAFQTPPLASPWLAARSERTGEVAAGGVARRRTALEGKVPAPAPVASARPALGAPGAFEGLARAMGSRFATASASTRRGRRRGRSSAAVSRRRPRARARRPATAAPPARAEPASWAEPPTRLSNPWQPLPLLCKRFGIPVPRVVSDAAALRERQFGGAPPRVTTGATASKNFGAALGAFLPGSDAAPRPRRRKRRAG